MKQRALGEVQRICLESLVRHDGYPGGWIYNNHSTTLRVLDALVQRGLATRTEKPGPYPHIKHVVYRPTTAGKSLIRGRK
jgi:hypothetical protein